MIFKSSFVYTLNVFWGGYSPVAVAVYACIAEVLTALCFVVVHCLPVYVLFSPACFLFCVCLLFFFLMWEALLVSVTRSNSFLQPFPKNRVPLPQGSMPAFFSAEGAWVVEMPHFRLVPLCCQVLRSVPWCPFLCLAGVLLRSIVDSLLPVCCFSIRFPRHRQILSQALIFFLASMRAWWLSSHPAFHPFGFIPGNSVFLVGLPGKRCYALPSIRLLCPRVW